VNSFAQPNQCIAKTQKNIRLNEYYWEIKPVKIRGINRKAPIIQRTVTGSTSRTAGFRFGFFPLEAKIFPELKDKISVTKDKTLIATLSIFVSLL